jgi:hypothetical protein
MTEIIITDDEPTPELALRNESDPCWTAARTYAFCIGHVPPLFSSCIRAINKADSVLESIDQNSVREMTVSACEFLIKVSPTLKAIFYFAAEALCPEKLQNGRPLSVRKLLSVLEPREVSSVLGATFLYKRVQKKCDPKEWMILQRKIHTQMEIGLIVGEKMRHIGRANGMLLGAVRYIAQATFAVHSLDTFKEFKKAARNSSQIFNLALEESFFGCNHLQVASLLVQELGFCMPRSPVSMSLGMDAMSVQPDNLPARLKEHLLSWKAAMAYIESYHSNGTPPEKMNLEYALELPTEEQEQFRSRIWEIIREGSQFDWISKTKRDLPDAIAKELEIQTVTGEPGIPGNKGEVGSEFMDDHTLE